MSLPSCVDVSDWGCLSKGAAGHRHVCKHNNVQVCKRTPNELVDRFSLWMLMLLWLSLMTTASFIARAKIHVLDPGIRYMWSKSPRIFCLAICLCTGSWKKLTLSGLDPGDLVDFGGESHLNLLWQCQKTVRKTNDFAGYRSQPWLFLSWSHCLLRPNLSSNRLLMLPIESNICWDQRQHLRISIWPSLGECLNWPWENNNS